MEDRIARVAGLSPDEMARQILAKQAILDSVPAHLAVLDSTGRIVEINDAWTRFAKANGLANPEAVGLGVNYLQVCRDASAANSPEAEEALTGIQAVLNGKLDRFTLEYPCDSPTVKRWFVMHVDRVRGQSPQATLVHMDITPQKLAEQELKAINETLERRVAQRTAESQQRASQLQRLAAQMTQAEEGERRRLSQVLHDHLQQSLVAAKLRLGAAKRKIRNQRTSTAIAEAINLVDEAIAESRSLSRELSPAVLYDRGLAAALEWLGRETEKKYRLPVAVDVAPNVEPQDPTVKIFVFQSVRELILNAVKHAKATSLKLVLSRPDDEHLEVVVRDNGTGFEPEVLQRDDKPAGFGLFSIRERLDVIGGRLTIRSTPEAGTRVSILAPCPRQPAEDVSGENRPETAHSRTEPIQVLLADDHPLLRKGLAELLLEFPDLNLVGEAGDGEQAAELALRIRPEVVLMDISMPRVDGIEATRRIKQAAPEVAVIGLSMLDRDDLAVAMREAGAADYVAKTAPVEDLVAAIVRQSRRHASEEGR